MTGGPFLSARGLVESDLIGGQLEGGRVAVVTGDHDLLYGIARMTATTMELAGLGFELRAFRKTEDAEQWVMNPVQRSESA